MTDHAPMKLEKHYTCCGYKGDGLDTGLIVSSSWIQLNIDDGSGRSNVRM